MILAIARLIRHIVSWIDLALLTAFLYLLSWLPRVLTRAYYQKLFHFWCRVYVRAFGVDLKLHQKNLKALPEHFIIIANHPSAFEDIGMPALFNALFLAKKEVKKWWVVGRISTAAGTLYVDRENKESRQQAKENIAAALKAGTNIGLYPEGGCKGRRIHLPFYYGVFELSIVNKVPIIPVFLHYEAQEAFEWNRQHLLHKIWQIFTAPNKTVNYYVYDALEPQNFSGKEEFCDHVQNMYLKWQQQYLE